MRFVILLAVASCVLTTAGTCPAHGETRLGGGIHYVRTLGDIKDDSRFDNDAYNIMGSLQFSGGLLTLEADVEWIPNYGGSDKSLWQPQAYLLLGGFIYGGVGIGIGHFDGEWQNDPFYALRAGVDFPLGPLYLDVNVNYRFQSTKVFEDLDEIDTDAVTFSAVVRFEL